MHMFSKYTIIHIHREMEYNSSYVIICTLSYVMKYTLLNLATYSILQSLKIMRNYLTMSSWLNRKACPANLIICQVLDK